MTNPEENPRQEVVASEAKQSVHINRAGGTPIKIGACANDDSEKSISNLKAVLETERQARLSAEAEITKRESVIAEINTAANEAKQSLTETVSAYKALVIRSNPAVPAELISGNSFKEIDISLDSARSLVSKVRLAVETEIASGKVPAGAPPRSAPDTESLTPREKIQYALSKGDKR
ncbi:MAG: hypothetical protein Q7R50_04390 [Dehalococcoidales bacterium]|nr:hypothetical protein [Dehalococcoidales bacterium]